jgi:arylsulfatase A
MVPFAYIENDRVTTNPTDDRDFPLMVGRPPATRKGPTAPGFAVENVLPDLTAKACGYIAERGKSGKPFFLYLPLASPHTAIAPTAEWLGKSGLNPYADFVMATDAAVGKLRQALADAGVADNTLILFTSDNGCSPQAKFPELLAKGHNPNHVFRGNKADIYEGGHRVPFFAVWPGKVQPGKTTDQLAVHTDIFRTCAEAGGATTPDASGEDSFSFLPTLLGKSNDKPRTAAVHHSINGSFAVRKGNWKLCLCPGSGGWSSPKPADKVAGLPPVQLFDLAADIGEKANRQADKPDVVKELTADIEKMVADGRTYPGGKATNAVAVELRK